VGGGASGNENSPAGPFQLQKAVTGMKVNVDDLWASPSMLHFRVTAFDEDGRWRHRYYPTMRLDQIPSEALEPLRAYLNGTEPPVISLDVPLF